MNFIPFPWRKGKGGATPLNPTDLQAAENNLAVYADSTAATQVAQEKARAESAEAARLSSAAEPGASDLVPRSTGSGRGVVFVNEKLNVQAIGRQAGIEPGGDYSAPVLAAISGLSAFELYFPADSAGYKLNLGELGKEEVGTGVSARFTSDGQRATFLAPVDATHPIVSIVGPADSSNQGVRFDHIGLRNTTHREYVGAQGTGHPLVVLNFTRKWGLCDVQLDGGELEGTAFAVESSYNMHWQDVQVVGGKFLVPFLHTNSKLAPVSNVLQQCDNFHFEDCVMSTFGPVFRNAHDELHHIIAQGLKCVQTTWYPTGATFLGVLAAEVSAGATAFTYNTGTAVGHPSVGDLIVVGTESEGKSIDPARVTAVNQATGEVTVSATNPLKFTHAAGAPVMNGGAALVVGDQAHLVLLLAPHFEGHTAGLMVGNVQQVDFHGFEDVAAYGVYYCGKTSGAIYIHGGWTQAGTALANELWHQAPDLTGTALGTFAVEKRPFVPEGAKPASNAPPSAVPYTWEFADENGGNNPVTRKNVNNSATNAKARLWQGTMSNAETYKVQASGRGYFKDSISVGDLGSITGKTSAEIDALLTITPTDTTAVGVIVATAEKEGKRVVLCRKTGAGNKWSVSAAYTEIA